MPVVNAGIDQDTPPEPMPGTEEEHARVQAAAVETEVEFSVGGHVDMGTQEEDFDPELSAAMDPGRKAEEEPEEEEDVIEILEPKSATKKWELGPEGVKIEYFQRPLSFIQKMQWFALVGEVLDKAMSGTNPVSLREIMDSPSVRRKGGVVTIADFKDADTFVRAIGKLIINAPEFLTDSFVIWLGVPSHERAMVSEMLVMPEEEGGLSDEDGAEIIEVFIDQNWDALASFFSERLGGIQKRIASRQELKRRRSA